MSNVSQSIVLIGDSWAEDVDARDALNEICPRAQVFELATGGTRASAWAREGLAEDAIRQLSADGIVPDYVWVSMGGNDLFQSFCGPPGGPEQVVEDIQTVMQLFNLEYPDAKLVYTGCAITPRVSVRECAEAFHAICTASDYPNYASVISLEGLFGGFLNETHLGMSDEKYFDDPIHLNIDGYRRLFGYEPVARALGCEPLTTNEEPPETVFPNPIEYIANQLYAFMVMLINAIGARFFWFS